MAQMSSSRVRHATFLIDRGPSRLSHIMILMIRGTHADVYVHGAKTLVFGRPAVWTWANRQDSVAVAAVGQPIDWTRISSFVFSMTNGSIFDHGRHQGEQFDKAGRLQHVATYAGAPLTAVAQAPPASDFLTRLVKTQADPSQN